MYISIGRECNFHDKSIHRHYYTKHSEFRMIRAFCVTGVYGVCVCVYTQLENTRNHNELEMNKHGTNTI